MAEVPQRTLNSLLQLPSKKGSNIFGDCCLHYTIMCLMKQLVSLFQKNLNVFCENFKIGPKMDKNECMY